MNGVKSDILAVDNRVTVRVSRSLSATSGISESSTAPTDLESNSNAVERKVIKMNDKNILGGWQGG